MFQFAEINYDDRGQHSSEIDQATKTAAHSSIKKCCYRSRQRMFRAPISATFAQTSRSASTFRVGFWNGSCLLSAGRRRAMYCVPVARGRSRSTGARKGTFARGTARPVCQRSAVRGVILDERRHRSIIRFGPGWSGQRKRGVGTNTDSLDSPPRRAACSRW